MHNLTSNHEFSVYPDGDLWVARLTFFHAPNAPEIGSGWAAGYPYIIWNNGRPISPNARKRSFYTAQIEVKASRPDMAMAALWAVADEIGAWRWDQKPVEAHTL